MAGGSLLALIDDIATILDDVAVLTKVAAKKTTGVLGDDLALNAEQVTGVNADRELPVVWAVAKGSLVNKVILVPTAFLISVFIPQLILPLLLIGGLFLCYEGAEKVIEKIFPHSSNTDVDKPSEAGTTVNEAEKIKGAIRTDFILSAEIITITLGAVAEATYSTQILVLSSIAFLMTVGVYGLVALIVKLDDMGLYLTQSSKSSAKKLGLLILKMAPKLMKTLGILGTLAMFLVGGGIVVHSIPWLHHLNESFESEVVKIPLEGTAGLIAGLSCWAVISFMKKRKKANA